MRWIGRVGVVGMCSAGLVVASVGWASEGSSFRVGDDQVVERESDESDDADVLAGPRATEAGTPGGMGVFAPSMDGRTMGSAGDRRTERWMERAMRGLMRNPPSPELALTDEQREAIGAATKAHEERVNVYRREHREELQRLREAAGIESNSDLRPQNRDQIETTPAMDAARQRMREINRGTPNQDQLRGEVWAVLTEPQREHINGAIERMHAEAAAQENADAMMGTGDAMSGEMDQRGLELVPHRAYTTGDARMDAFVDRVMALPEAQRERLLQRLTGMMDRFENAERERRRRDAPPTMDGVDVPRSR